MNLVLDDAEEVYIEKEGKEVKPRQDLGESYYPICHHSSPLSCLSGGYKSRRSLGERR